MNQKIKARRLISAATFFSNMVFFAPVAILLRTRCGLSVSQFFILQALLSFAIFLLEVPLGFITDKIGYKKSVLFSQILVSITRLIFLIGGNFWVFALEAVVEAVAICLSSGSSLAYTYESFGEENYIKWNAIIANFGTISFILTTLAFTPLNEMFGLEGLILATLIASLFPIIFWFFIPNEKVFVSHENESMANSEGVQTTISLRYFFKNLMTRDVFVMVTLSALLSLGGLLTNFFYILRLQESGFNDGWISFIILTSEGVKMLSPIIIGKVEKFNTRLLLGAELFLTALAFLLVALLNNFILFIPMIILPLALTMPEYIITDITNKLINKFGLQDNRAAFLSVLNEVSNIFEIVFLFSASALEAMKGKSISILFFAFAILFILASLSFLLRRKSIA